jgi:hypothetical protein
MKRVVIDHFGGLEVLEVVEDADPRPGPGEVRVRREAALQELHDRHASELWRFAMRLTMQPSTTGGGSSRSSAVPLVVGGRSARHGRVDRIFLTHQYARGAHTHGHARRRHARGGIRRCVAVLLQAAHL